MSIWQQISEEVLEKIDFETRIKLDGDMILYGNAFLTPDGERIAPQDVLPLTYWGAK